MFTGMRAQYFPNMLLFYIKPNLQISDFHDFFNYSWIVTEIFTVDSVFYRFAIIENICKNMYNGDKYIVFKEN